jgi:hypothetical protein
MRGENEDVGISAQLFDARLVYPARKTHPSADTNVIRELAELVDRPVAGKRRAPVKGRHRWAAESLQKFRNAFSSAQTPKKEQMGRFA